LRCGWKSTDDGPFREALDQDTRLAEGSQASTVGSEGEAVNALLVFAARPDFAACPRVPELDRPVPAGRSEQPAIGTEGAIVDHIGMAAQGEAFLPRIGIPDFEGAIVAGRRQAPAIGTEGDSRDGGFVSGQGPRVLLAATLQMRPLPAA